VGIFIPADNQINPIALVQAILGPKALGDGG